MAIYHFRFVFFVAVGDLLVLHVESILFPFLILGEILRDVEGRLVCNFYQLVGVLHQILMLFQFELDRAVVFEADLVLAALEHLLDGGGGADVVGLRLAHALFLELLLRFLLIVFVNY